MKLNEELFEIDIPIINTEDELVIDDIEQPVVATPEENGVATILTDSISDLWNKISEYNSKIATIYASGVENAEEIISVLKDIVNEENRNIGKLVATLKTVSPNTENIEVGEQEAMMKLNEDFKDSKADLLSNILSRSISTSQENYIYDGWRAFYNDPELFRDTLVVDLVNKGLDMFNENNTDSNTETDNIEDNLIVENINTVHHKIGTEEYDANEGRKKRINQYRKLAHVNEDVILTEDMIDNWALNKTACYNNRSVDQVRSEILGQRWSEFEED